MAKSNKMVLLMLALHHDQPKIDRETWIEPKPEMVTFYNKTKDGVDVVQICSNYSASQNTKCWLMILFYLILNIYNNINILTVYPENDTYKIPRRHFPGGLGLELIKDHLKHRKNKMFLPRELCKKIVEHSELTGERRGTESQRSTVRVNQGTVEITKTGKI